MIQWNSRLKSVHFLRKRTSNVSENWEERGCGAEAKVPTKKEEGVDERGGTLSCLKLLECLWMTSFNCISLSIVSFLSLQLIGFI